MTEEQSKKRMQITNNIPHHGFENINKAEKIPLAFDAGLKYNETSLNQNSLKGPNYLSKLKNL